MTIPKRYEDLTVSQFQQLEALKAEENIDSIDKAVKRLSILSGESIDFIESLRPKVVYDTLLDAIYLNSPIHDIPLKDTVVLGSKKFKAITQITDFTVAQHKDFNTFLQLNNNNYIACLPEIIAICHAEKIGGVFKYEPANHFENLELFKAAKLKDVMGAVFFYSNCLKSYSKIIAVSLESNTKLIKEMMTEMENDKGFQDFLNNGGGTIR